MFSKTSSKQRALVIGLVLLGSIFTIFFGIRAFHAYKKFNGYPPPPHEKIETDVNLIRNWMTIPFISETYRVPEHLIFNALQVPPIGNKDKSLNDLNHEYYPNHEGAVLEKVKETVLANLPAHILLTPAAH